jgi:hypothetical protein
MRYLVPKPALHLRGTAAYLQRAKRKDLAVPRQRVLQDDECASYLTETGLTRILNISAGQLAYHVESLVIDCDTILSKHNFNCSSQSSDFNKNDWWDGDSNDSFGEYCFTRISFDDRIMDLLKFGGCADLLGRFLSGFSNL